MLFLLWLHIVVSSPILLRKDLFALVALWAVVSYLTWNAYTVIFHSSSMISNASGTCLSHSYHSSVFTQYLTIIAHISWILAYLGSILMHSSDQSINCDTLGLSHICGIDSVSMRKLSDATISFFSGSIRSQQWSADRSYQSFGRILSMTFFSSGIISFVIMGYN